MPFGTMPRPTGLEIPPNTLPERLDVAHHTSSEGLSRCQPKPILTAVGWLHD